MFTVENAEKRAEASPEAFSIPSREARDALIPGDVAKIMFIFGSASEQRWVEVSGQENGLFVGKVADSPLRVPGLKLGDLVKFGPEHVFAVKPRRPVQPAP